MSPFFEHRLAHLKAKKVTTRGADKASLAQNANASTKGVRIGSNPNADIVERDVQSNYQNPGSSEGANILTPEQKAANDNAMDLADARKYVTTNDPAPVINPRAAANQAGAKRPKGAIVDATPEDRARRLGVIVAQGSDLTDDQRGSIQASGGTLNDPAYIASLRASNAETSSAAATELTELQEQQKNIRQQTQIGSPTLDGLPEDLQGAYQPTIDAANRKTGLAATEFNDVKGEIKTAAAAALEQKTTDEAGALQTYEDKLAFNDKLDKLAYDRTEETQRRLLAENVNAEKSQNIEEARAEQLQRDQNIQAELQNRRLAAKLGINHDTGGLQWMHDEVRKGTETLAYLIARNAQTDVQSANQRIDIINGYSLDMRQVDMDSQQRYDSAYSSYQSEKSAIKKDWLAGEKDRNQQLKDARTRYYDKLYESDKDKAQAYQDARLKAWDREFEVEKLEWEKEKYELEKASDAIIDPMKTFDRAAQISEKIQGLQDVKDFNEIDSKYSRAELAWTAYENGDLNSKSILDNTLIKTFERILDPQSVVRETEFQATGKMQPFIDRWGKLGWEKVFQGGAGINDEIRAELVDLMKAMRDTQMEKALQASQPYYMQARYFNSVPGVQMQISPDMLPLMDRADLPQGSIDMMEDLIFSDTPPPYGGMTVDSLPPNGATVESNMLNGTAFYGSKFWDKGLDISASAGTTISIPFGGTVEKVVDNFRQGFPNDPKRGKAQNGGWGNQVRVKMDNGYVIQVSHLSRTDLRSLQGQRIEAGTIVGLVGNTGNTYGPTGNHADITVYRPDGSPLNAHEVAALIGVRGQSVAAAPSTTPPQAEPPPKVSQQLSVSNAPKATGTTMSMQSPNVTPQALSKRVTFRDNSTGTTITVNREKSQPYIDRPDLFTQV